MTPQQLAEALHEKGWDSVVVLPLAEDLPESLLAVWEGPVEGVLVVKAAKSPGGAMLPLMEELLADAEAMHLVDWVHQRLLDAWLRAVSLPGSR